MAEDKDELSDEEYDALLRDLEGRAASGGGGAGDASSGDDEEVDVEDIDAFLSSLEDEDSGEGAAKTTTAQAGADDDLAAQFASLEEKGELSAPPEKKASKKKKKKGKKKKSKKKEKKSDKSKNGEASADSRGKRVAKKAAKTAFWFAPTLVLWWVLGAYLGQWVSAAWLIAAMGAMFVFGMPAILKKLVKRGSYRPWVFGYSLVLTVVLVAPMPNVAGEALSAYGHWPSSVIAEVSGGDSDAAYVRAQASASQWLGGLVAPGADPDWQALELGTVFPLGFAYTPEELAPLLEEGVDLEELLPTAEEGNGE